MKILKNLLAILAGNTLYAIAVTFFIVPNELITGGTTGLGLFLQKTVGLPMEGFVGAFNVVMFLLGAVVLGKKFAVTTMISTFYYPLALLVFGNIFGEVQLTNDSLLAVIFAGVLIGGGIGLVIRGGASTGGMDIPPLILHKKFQIPIAVTMYVLDFVILLSQALDTSAEKILYGMLLVLLYTIVLNKVLIIGTQQIQIKIISHKYRKISQEIQQKLDRGTTLFEIEGGYSGDESYAVLAVVGNRELMKVKELVLSIDGKAFMIINEISEVRGRGFTLDKRYEKMIGNNEIDNRGNV